MQRLTYIILHDKKQRQSLWWNIRRVIEEHKFHDEFKEIEDMLVRDTYVSRIIAMNLLKELKENEYLMPACVKMEGLHDFLETGL